MGSQMRVHLEETSEGMESTDMCTSDPPRNSLECSLGVHLSGLERLRALRGKALISAAVSALNPGTTCSSRTLLEVTSECRGHSPS